MRGRVALSLELELLWTCCPAVFFQVPGFQRTPMSVAYGQVGRVIIPPLTSHDAHRRALAIHTAQSTEPGDLRHPQALYSILLTLRCHYFNCLDHLFPFPCLLVDPYRIVGSYPSSIHHRSQTTTILQLNPYFGRDVRLLPVSSRSHGVINQSHQYPSH